MEPEWTKGISSEVVCNFFYVFFMVYAVVAIFSIFALVSLFFMNLPKNVMIGFGIQSTLMLAIATVTALFHYLVCSRALLPATGGMRRMEY